MKHYYKHAFQALILIIVLTQTSCKKASQEEPITQTEAITPELKTKEINPGENHLKDVEQPVVINKTQSKATRQLIIYQPSTRYQHKDYGYVKGQVSGQGFETAQIYISGEKASPRSGYFEQLAKRTTGNPTGDWRAEIKAIFTDGDTLITYADFSNNNLGEDQKDIPLEIKELSPESQTTLSYSSATLYIEPGAVKEKKTISVSPLEEEEMSLLSPQLSNITQTHTGYRFLPDGTKFEKELTLTIGYDKSKIPFGYGPQDIYTYYYDETRKSWIQLERDSIDEQKQIVYSRTDHFTDYINGILKTPETSDAMAYTPTSIKDLEAAQPLNGITMMSPPQANNKGTANLSYPITVPQGRRGMQPDLNITYNSSGGNGWLGLGWDLSISSITVETRWGV
ncbi:MAG: SpvB/TcaC N-terminal domain-containing protein, partial [Bacteroidales bacterium]